MKKFGLNLYSLRTFIATPETLFDTVRKLQQTGYSYFQYSGAPFDKERLKKLVDETGAEIRLTHMPADRILGDTERVVEENLYFGNKNIGLGASFWNEITDEKTYKEHIEKYDRAGEKMEKFGCKFFWHNHNFEFIKHDGKTVMDYIIENAPHINFTLDTYWAQYGGVNVLEYLEKLNGRIGCVHLKDYRTKFFIDDNGVPKFVPEFAPLGDGVMNFKAIVAKMKEVGVENFFVEQDNAVDFPDPMGLVKRSADYINKEIDL